MTRPFDVSTRVHFRTFINSSLVKKNKTDWFLQWLTCKFWAAFLTRNVNLRKQKKRRSKRGQRRLYPTMTKPITKMVRQLKYWVMRNCRYFFYKDELEEYCTRREIHFLSKPALRFLVWFTARTQAPLTKKLRTRHCKRIREDLCINSGTIELFKLLGLKK